MMVLARSSRSIHARSSADPGVVAWWDVAFTAVYTSYFIVPFALAGWLWARERPAFVRFTKRLVTLALAGLATYIVFPAAPPWMASGCQATKACCDPRPAASKNCASIPSS